MQFWSKRNFKYGVSSDLDKVFMNWLRIKMKEVLHFPNFCNQDKARSEESEDGDMKTCRTETS